VKRIATVILILLFSLAGFQSCKDLGTAVPVPTSPPTPFVPGPQSFSADIHPILLANCATAGCHTGSTPSSGFDQSTYAGLRSGGVRYGAAVIVPGDSANSGIINVLRGTGLVARMPVGGPFTATGLPDTMIVKIGAWIQQGALNN